MRSFMVMGAAFLPAARSVVEPRQVSYEGGMTQAATFAMSAPARSASATPHETMDRAVGELRANAREFARLSPARKRELLLELVGPLQAVAEGWVEAGCRAKGIAHDTATGGEEWLAGPSATMRNVRLLAESLASIAATGKPPFGRGAHTRGDGRVEVAVMPTSGLEGVMFSGFSGRVLLQPGVDEKTGRERQASFYAKQDPEGGVSLILGAGNVSSIPPMDALYKMFVDGNVCLIKMNPVNEWVGPFLEKALAPLVDKGYLRIVYGGGEEGAYLCQHAGIDDIHITGSDKTHDLIVWGPPGAERDRRIAANDPLLKKTITSELGNVSPVAIVPANYSQAELWFQARNVATMVVNNGSFNCNAGKILILSKGWAQREEFMRLVAKALASVPPRKAYYPGARQRYEDLLAGRDRVEKFGTPDAESLAWALIRDVDSSKKDERLFYVEPFCGLLSETTLAPSDPVAFLEETTRFCNDRLWGTLNATLIVHPTLEKDAGFAAALDKAILALRYGTVAINHWPAIGYGFVSTPWGGHPSATLKDIQSGVGWVHNTYMLEEIEKCIVRGPLVAAPKPAWFFDNERTHLLGRKMVGFEASPSVLKVPGIAITALQG